MNTSGTHLRGYRELVGIAVVVALVLGSASVMRSGRSTDDTRVPIDIGAQTGSMANVPDQPADWPPMRLIYRSDDAVVRLEYVNARQWRKEIIENPTHRNLVGTVTTFIDTTYAEYESGTIDRPATILEIPGDGVAVPARWIRPDFADLLADRHFVVSPGDKPFETVYTQIFFYPCVATPTPDDPHPPLPQPKACAMDSTYQEVEMYVFRTDITPPLVVAGRTESEGKAIWEFEVLDIELVPHDLDFSAP